MNANAAAPQLTPEQRLIAGQISVLTIRGVTVTFPSTRFCKNQVDDNFLSHVDKIVSNGRQNYGNGAVSACGQAHCGHMKLTGGDAIAYYWTGDAAVSIIGHGVKGGRGAAAKGSGGYTWEN
jgi:hypothetical protein